MLLPALEVSPVFLSIPQTSLEEAPPVQPTSAGLSASSTPVPIQNSKSAIRLFVAAENRLLREALARMLNKCGSIEVTGADSPEPFQGSALLEAAVAVMLLISSGNLGGRPGDCHSLAYAAFLVRVSCAMTSARSAYHRETTG